MSPVTVIIPTFNHARHLGGAIRSVLGQSHPDFAVIVVDDGSTDDPAAVVRAIADPRVQLVRQANAGLAAARNTGIRHAAHPFVAFLDADDEFLPDYLRQATAAFGRLPADFGIIACNRIRCDQDGVRLPERKAATGRDREITARDLLFRNRFVAEVVARREIFDRCGLFDTSLRSSEDRDMWLRVAARYRIWLCARPQLLIRRHPGSMSHHADRMRANMRQVIEKARAAGVVPGDDRAFWRQVYAMNWHEVAWMHHEEGRPFLALTDLCRSLWLWPWFARPAAVAEPPLFRLRASRHFAAAALRRAGPPPAAPPAR